MLAGGSLVSYIRPVILSVLCVPFDPIWQNFHALYNYERVKVLY